MSDAPNKQLREYGEFHDEEQDAVTMAEIRERGVAEIPVRQEQTPAPETTEPWPEFEGEVEESRPSLWDALLRPRVLAALGSVVAVATVIGLVVILSSADTDSPPRAEDVSGPTASPAGGAPVPTQPPAPVATPAPAVSSLTWSRVADDEFVSGGPIDQTMQSVTVGGPGLVAVGADSSGAAVWTSVDGLSWSRVPDDESIFTGAGMAGVTVGGPGLVAVGGDRSGSRSSVAAVWTSVDGLTWSRVPHDDAVFGGGGFESFQSMKSVTAGGPGLVAVGEDVPNAAVWTSVDGLTWSRVPHDEAVFGGEASSSSPELFVSMEDVTVGGPGLVAVGQGGGSFHMEWWTGLGSAVVWTSVDGLSWSRVPHDEAVFGGDGDQLMTSVTVGGAGLVAVGLEGSRPDENETDAAVWTSVDGATWSRVPHEEAVFGGGALYMGSVTAGGPGLVAVGSDWSGSVSDAAAWTSVDGVSWSRVPDDPSVFGGLGNQTMTSVIAVGPGLVAVGDDKAGGDAAVWVAAFED